MQHFLIGFKHVTNRHRNDVHIISTLQHWRGIEGFSFKRKRNKNAINNTLSLDFLPLAEGCCKVKVQSSKGTELRAVKKINKVQRIKELVPSSYSLSNCVNAALQLLERNAIDF